MSYLVLHHPIHTYRMYMTIPTTHVSMTQYQCEEFEYALRNCSDWLCLKKIPKENHFSYEPGARHVVEVSALEAIRNHRRRIYDLMLVRDPQTAMQIFEEGIRKDGDVYRNVNIDYIESVNPYDIEVIARLSRQTLLEINEIGLNYDLTSRDFQDRIMHSPFDQTSGIFNDNDIIALLRILDNLEIYTSRRGILDRMVYRILRIANDELLERSMGDLEGSSN